MNRLLFEKTGKAIYISHLDTMALFPRLFLRAGLHIRFTNGMSPHAYVSIALPLSVGSSSQCEILDFELVEEDTPLESLPDRLNACAPAGIRVLAAYDSPKKIKELCYLRCEVHLEYDSGISDAGVQRLNKLFSRDSLLVEKKTKKGMVDTDIRPMMQQCLTRRLDAGELVLDAFVCAQNPALNPRYLVDAITRYEPDLTPDFSWTHRVEVYDSEHRIFR